MNISLPSGGADRRVDAAPASPPPPAASAASAEAQRSLAQPEKPDASAQIEAMRKELEQSLVEANRRMQLNGRNLAFSLDEKAGRMVIKVTNSQTGEVVRQIPDQTVLRIAHTIEDLKGILHDESS
jgi:flagellar protein FlaG